MIYTYAALAFGVVVCALIPVLGRPGIYFAALVCGLALFPKRLFHDVDSAHVGVSTASAIPYVFTLLIAGGCVLAAVQLRRKASLVMAGILSAVLLTGLVVWWQHDALTEAGVLHYATGLLAIPCGVWLAERAHAAPRHAYDYAWTVTAVICVQVVIAALQVSQNVSQFTASNVGQIARSSGTLGHPGTLAKAAFLLFMVVLPLTRSDDSRTARLATVATVLGLFLTLLTLGRANILAVLLALAVWSLWGARTSLVRRALTVVAVGAVVYPFTGAVATRIARDPTGGDRPELTRAAMHQLSRTPLLGTGPNSYVEVVGRFDLDTALGFPVHNAFLLLTAELGIPIAALLFLLPLVLGVGALRHVRDLGAVGTHARALVCCAPGLFVQAWTGWGLLGGSIFPLCTLVLGMYWGFMHPSPPQPSQHPEHLGESAIGATLTTAPRERLQRPGGTVRTR